MDFGSLIALIIIIAVFVITISAIISIAIVSSKIEEQYEDFVFCHSVAIKKLLEINQKYQFNEIDNFDMVHRYDNKNFYNEISCKDYLTYQLVYVKRKVKAAMKDTLFNKNLYEKYVEETGKISCFNQYDVDELPKNKRRLAKIEKNVFYKCNYHPTINFSITVKLISTNINGRQKRSKHQTFYPKDISDIIFKINQKNGNFYLVDEIWKSICKVERGKVTNRLRFQIYARDHNRCRRCGRYSDNLEIDHIVPIAKGGKSTPDNLQSLCPKCNKEKGTRIIRY